MTASTLVGQAEALLQNLHLAAAAGEGLSAILPRVFEQWIHRCSSPTAADEADTTAATADDDLTSGATLGKRRRPTETDASELGESGDGGGTTGPRQWSESSPPTAAKAAKVAAETSRQQSASDSDTMDLGTHERAGERVGDGMDGPRDPLTVAQPIDHIFQFHRALRRELDKLEKQSQQLLDLHTGALPHLSRLRALVPSASLIRASVVVSPQERDTIWLMDT
jgi:hypothetical protein